MAFISDILFVNDDSDFLLLAIRCCKELGISATYSVDPVGTLKTIEPGQHNLVIADVVMFPISGQQFAREVFEKTHTKVALMSQYGKAKLEIDARLAGIKNFVAKPDCVQLEPDTCDDMKRFARQVQMIAQVAV